jgi:hypothetical protein
MRSRAAVDARSPDMKRRVGYGFAVLAGLSVVYYVIPFVVAVTSLGEICPYSPAGTTLCERSAAATTHIDLPPGIATHLQSAGGELCSKPGIRYAGTTSEGAEVCFTLTRDHSAWAEIGFKFIRASGCAAGSSSATGQSYYEGPEPLTDPRRIVAFSFAATIDGLRAAGTLGDPKVCGSKKFTWSARRKP